MKSLVTASVASLIAVSTMAVAFEAQPPQAPPTPPTSASQPVNPADTARENAAWVQKLTAAMAGKEGLPAREVFKNVTSLGEVPAARMLRIMQFGYARSLGVACAHCHDTNAWEADTRGKQIARQMGGLVQAINMEQLPKIKNLASERPAVNCTTCHRGQIKPALDLPPAP